MMPWHGLCSHALRALRSLSPWLDLLRVRPFQWDEADGVLAMRPLAMSGPPRATGLRSEVGSGEEARPKEKEDLIFCESCDERPAEIADEVPVGRWMGGEPSIGIRYTCGRCAPPMSVRPGMSRRFLRKPGVDNSL